MQGLYAVSCGEIAADDVLESVIVDKSLSKKQIAFARDLFTLVNQNSEWADRRIASLSENWDIKRIAAIDLTIIRLALVEMEKMVDVPIKVVINEAIELAKTYSTENSSRFVNGILDRHAKDIRDRG